MTAYHSPTPWHVGPLSPAFAEIRDAEDGEVVEKMFKNDAAYVCEAVNTFAAGGADEAIARLRDALDPFPSLCCWLVENAGKEALGAEITKMVPLLRLRMKKAMKALEGARR